MTSVKEYERIIPPDVISELIFIGESASECSFRVGDITNECIRLNELAENDITHQLVYSAVGAFCGKASRTVRYYAEVAERFPGYVRTEYEPLSFSHFAFAMKYKNWDDILEFAMANMDEKGRPATVDALIAIYGYPEKEVADSTNILDLVKSLRKEVLKLPLSGDIRQLVTEALQRIVEAITKGVT